MSREISGFETLVKLEEEKKVIEKQTASTTFTQDVSVCLELLMSKGLSEGTFLDVRLRQLNIDIFNLSGNMEDNKRVLVPESSVVLIKTEVGYDISPLRVIYDVPKDALHEDREKLHKLVEERNVVRDEIAAVRLNEATQLNNLQNLLKREYDSKGTHFIGYKTWLIECDFGGCGWLRIYSVLDGSTLYDRRFGK